MTGTPPPPHRGRGAPLGNTNALKHGFYSAKFKSGDLAALADHQFRGLEDEIAMLRLCTRNVVERAKEATTLNESLDLLRTLCPRYFLLNHLVRTQQLLHPENPLHDTLSEALASILEDAPVDPPPDPSPGAPS